MRIVYGSNVISMLLFFFRFNCVDFNVFVFLFSNRYISGPVPLPCPPLKMDFNRCHRSQYDQLTMHICQQPTRVYHDSIFRCILVKLYCDTSYYWPSKLRTLVLFKHLCKIVEYESKRKTKTNLNQNPQEKKTNDKLF